MSDDLIERLKDAAATIGACDDGYGQAAVLEAAAELTRLRADVESLTASLAAEVEESERLRVELADERRHADVLADALTRARDYINGPMIDRVKPMVRQCDEAIDQHRARRQG